MKLIHAKTEEHFDVQIPDLSLSHYKRIESFEEDRSVTWAVWKNGWNELYESAHGDLIKLLEASYKEFKKEKKTL
jgi:hypothetical protein